MATDGLRLTLRVGRAEHPLGDGRLVSLREGPNVRVAFDGARALFAFGGAGGAWSVDAFAQQTVDVTPGVLDDGRVDGEYSWGAFSMGRVRGLRLGGHSARADLFYVGYHTEAAFVRRRVVDSERHSLGVRVYAGPESEAWTADAEVIGQLGDAGGVPVRALFARAGVGYRFRRAPLRPDIGLLVDVASGDRDPADAVVGSFEAVVPTNQIFGLRPVVGGVKNLIHVKPRLRAELPPTWGGIKLEASYAFFYRFTTADIAYGPGKNALAPEYEGPEPTARVTGQQLLLDAEYRLSRYTHLSLRYERWVPGAYFRTISSAATPQDYYSATLLLRG